jgi:transposase
MRHGAAFSRGSKSPSMQNQLFEAALGIAKPWYVRGVDFDAARKVLTIGIDFVNFFQHECYLEVRTPRVRLPDGRVVQIEPDWFGKLSGFTLLFEALVLALAQQMTFAAVARLVNESWHRVHAICSRYVNLAVAEADLSKVAAVAIDETACRRGHDYLTIAADAAERRVVFVTEGRDAATIGALLNTWLRTKRAPRKSPQ